MHRLFDLQVRHHLAADFAESRQAIGDAQEPVVIYHGEIASAIPVVMERRPGQLGLAEIPDHPIRAARQQQPFLIRAQFFHALRIHNL